MVLRKPYAFFIKMFKPIHIILAILISYLIYLNSSILRFLNNYISTYSGLSNTISTTGLSSPLLIIIPVTICILLLLILGIMVRKRKPIIFYIVNISIYIAIIIVNVYALNFLKTIDTTVVSIKLTKLIHDLVFLAIAAEIGTLVLFVTRGFGLNIKKFDFDSDLLSMDISESDMEEFEVSLNLNIDENRRKRKRFFRLLKYRYFENKVLINSIIVGVVGVIVVSIVFVLNSNVNRNVQGNIYNVGNVNINVKNTYLLNTDYSGNKITDNYLVVVRAGLNSYMSSNVYLKDFGLRVGNVVLKPTTKYNKYLVDIGVSSDEFILSSEFNDYIFVYEIPESIKNQKMLFRCDYRGNDIEINLKPNNEFSKTSKTSTIGEEAIFENNLGKVSFKITDYDIQEKYSFEYLYCINKDDCVNSLEYLKPSINENFDKAILKITVEYLNESTLDSKNFYDFFNMFGSIYYNVDGEWKIQNSKFENLSPLKVKTNNDVYIGINSEALRADSLKLVFNVRGTRYEYLLK